MNQEIVMGYPPIIKEIDAVFRVMGKPVFYSWGRQIFNPTGQALHPALIAHEAVHGERQIRMGVREWWDIYLHDEAFRLHEELHAHIAEYDWYIKNGNRNERRMALKQTAKSLAAPLYGRMITADKAKKLLREGSHGSDD